MRSLSTLFFTLLVLYGFSQGREGVVTYESLLKIDVSRIPAEFRSVVPKERKGKHQLFFNEKEALYKSAKREEDANRELGSGDGNRMRFRMRGQSRDEFYTNIEEGLSLNKSEFFGRAFLIEGNDEVEWKITSEMKTIAGYQCMKATSVQQDTIPVAAWFTVQLPVPIGPSWYSGLPGLILAIDINEGQRTIVATNVDLRPLTEEEAIIPPEKGKRVTREEFREIQREKIEEMREMNGGRGGNFRIRRN